MPDRRSGRFELRPLKFDIHTHSGNVGDGEPDHDVAVYGGWLRGLRRAVVSVAAGFWDRPAAVERTQRRGRDAAFGTGDRAVGGDWNGLVGVLRQVADAELCLHRAGQLYGQDDRNGWIPGSFGHLYFDRDGEVAAGMAAPAAFNRAHGHVLRGDFAITFVHVHTS
jgi:hypothetical protein